MRTLILITSLLIAALAVSSPAMAAGQRSFEAIITESFAKIDRRSSEQADRASTAGIELDRLLSRIRGLDAELKREKNAERRSELNALITRGYAQYVAITVRVLDGAIDVVGKNLLDLRRAREAMRRSGEATDAPEELRRRIEQNVTAGKGMRRALEQLTRWAKARPAVAASANRLFKTMKDLDRAITVDKMRLGRDGAAFGSGAAQVDQMMDALGDAYAALVMGRRELELVAKQVAMAVQLGELGLAKKAAQRVMPSIFGQDPAPGQDGVLEVLKGVTRLNRDAIADLSADSDQASGQGGVGTVLPNTTGFKNF